MDPIHYFFSRFSVIGVLALGAGACGNAAASNQTEAELSASSLFKGISALDTASRSHLASATAALTITEYYQTLLRVAPTKPMVIAGYSFSDAVGSLKNQDSFFTNLATAYPSVGAYWQATGYEPLSIFDQTSFAKSLSAGATAPHALGLATDPECDDSAITDPARLPIVGSNVNGNSPQDHVATDYINNYASFMNAVKNKAADPSSGAAYHYKSAPWANTTFAQITDGKNLSTYQMVRWTKGDAHLFTQQSFEPAVPGACRSKLTNLNVDPYGTVTRMFATTVTWPEED